MCGPLAAITAILGGVQAATSLFGGKAKPPQPAAPPPPPQPSQAPSAAGVRAGVSANGGAPASGPGGGEASTFLTAPGGVDNKDLSLGRNSILGLQ